MSRIPNSAIPHAKVKEEEPAASRSAFGQFTDTIRENPKTAIAAGAAVAAGVTAAAVIGTRARNGNSRAKTKK